MEEVFETNEKKFYDMGMIPDPPCKKYALNIDYDPSEEEKFDENKHLALEDPENIRIFEGDSMKSVSFGSYKKETSKKFSDFACSNVFRVFSDEGAAEIRRIAFKLKKYRVAGVRNNRVRSVWYYSPFFKDFMSSPKFVSHMSKIFGEPVLPYMYLTTTGHVNYGPPGMNKKVDEWHFDSVAFVAVIILSDIEGMQGGELQFIPQRKSIAQELFKSSKISSKDVETVSYKQNGYCIAAQGSELCHQVTPVISAKEDRISLVVSFQPANVYQPDRFCYHSMKSSEEEDNKPGVADYDMFRYRAFHAMKVLEDYVKNEPFTLDQSVLTGKLEAVAAELREAAEEIRTKGESGNLGKNGIGFYTDSGKFEKNPDA